MSNGSNTNLPAHVVLLNELTLRFTVSNDLPLHEDKPKFDLRSIALREFSNDPEVVAHFKKQADPLDSPNDIAKARLQYANKNLSAHLFALDSIYKAWDLANTSGEQSPEIVNALNLWKTRYPQTCIAYELTHNCEKTIDDPELHARLREEDEGRKFLVRYLYQEKEPEPLEIPNILLRIGATPENLAGARAQVQAALAANRQRNS